MNYIVDKPKALKRWGKVLEKMHVTDPEKQEWLAEMAELHNVAAMNENVAYGNLGVMNGMGPVTAPVPSTIPGSVYGTGSAQGSGDIAQNLLPVSMKIAAHTIGLDLVAVKPTASPRVELFFLDFKYDNNSETGFGEKDERPLVFKLNCTNLSTLQAEIKYLMAAQSTPITEIVGGISNRLFIHLSGGTMSDYFALGVAGGLAATTHTTEPTVANGREGWLEFLGFSRVDGYPMFRTFRQHNTAAAGNWGFQGARNTFNSGTTTILDVLNTATLIDLKNVTGGTVNFALTGVTINLVSVIEDEIPGFSAAWNMNQPMDRNTSENTYPGVIGPDVFSRSVQIGDLEISAAVKRTQIEDIKASTGIDIVQKLEAVCINEITQIISKQIVTKIHELAETNRTSYTAPKDSSGNPKFDFNVDSYVGASPTYIGPAPGGENTHTIQRKLIAKIRNASNFIATDGRVGPATYLVTNGNMCGVIQDIANYTINPVEAKMVTGGQLYPAGKIGGIDIYVDPYQRWDDNNIYLGRKNTVDQPGILFIPYLMAQTIQLISEGTFAPRLLVRSRFSIVDYGFFPHKQFMAIHVTDNNGVLI